MGASAILLKDAISDPQTGPKRIRKSVEITMKPKQ